MARRRTAARKSKSAAYTGLRRAQGAPARNGFLLLVLLGALVVLNLYVFVWDQKSGVRALKQRAEATQPAMKISDRALTAPAPASAPEPAQAVEGKVEKADTLGRLLRRNGLTGAEGDEVIRALAGVLDYKAIRPGASYRIERSRDGRIVRFDLEIAKGRHIRAERKPSGELIGVSN